ncbi:MAG: FdtA/QdtA family cupin domain-containing protein [Verrucomicrobiales bacterium]
MIQTQRLDQLCSWLSGRAVLLQSKAHDDSRGRLIALDFEHLSFEPKRVFYVQDVPAGTSRGGHAHRSCDQLLACMSGRIEIEMRADGEVEQVLLEQSNQLLLIRAGVWAVQKFLTSDSSLLVLASEPYDPASYL